MRRQRPLAPFAVVALALLFAPAGSLAEKFKVYDRISVGGAVVEGDLIDLGIDHQGVKLEAITFSEDEARLIVWNRTGSKVNVNAGLALFDEGGLLIAAESDNRPLTRSIFSIKSGKQANLNFKLKKFLGHVTEASTFRLVVTLVEEQETTF